MAYPLNLFQGSPETGSTGSRDPLPRTPSHGWIERLNAFSPAHAKQSSRSASRDRKSKLFFEALEPRLLLSADIPLVPSEWFSEDAALADGLPAAQAPDVIAVGLDEAVDPVEAARAEVGGWPLANRDVDVLNRSLDERLGAESLFSVGNFPYPLLYSEFAPDGEGPLPSAESADAPLDLTLRFTEMLDTPVFQLIDNTRDDGLILEQALAGMGKVGIVGSGSDDRLTLELAGDLDLGSELFGLFSFDGGGGNDTLVGWDLDSTWTVTGTDEGSLGRTFADGIPRIPGIRMDFLDVENLQGAVDNEDTFVFEADGVISGVIDGAAGGFDTLVLGACRT